MADSLSASCSSSGGSVAQDKDPRKGESCARRRTRPAPRAVHSRCPYCHHGIQIEQTGWTCCSLCLARHHLGCWREFGCCASCGGEQSLTFVQTRSDLHDARSLRARDSTTGTLVRAARKRSLAAMAAALATGVIGVLLLSV
ncbi:MAG: hypothetical protein JKY65_04535 [Planctomycetes bacterium]|nr:hypothetical protein [Planctomycetota bacterium]